MKGRQYGNYYDNYQYIDEYGRYNNINNENKYNTQSMLNKQEIIKIQDSELSNDTMCRVLTLGEKYALGENYKYGAYNMSTATDDDLLRLFVREIEIFRLSYQDFVEEHNCEYKFPKNLSKTDIINDINKWISFAPKESYQYYLALKDILNGQYNFSLRNEIKKLKAKKKKVNYKEGEKAKNLMNHVPIISHNTKKLAKNAEENYMKDKNYEVQVNLSNKRNQKDLNKLSKNAHYEEEEYEEEDPK